MFDIKGIHCFLNTAIKFWIAAVVYIFILVFGADHKSLDWVAWRLVLHLLGGLLFTIIRKRHFVFGLLNLGCEISRLTFVTMAAIFPISIGLLLGFVPRQLFGIAERDMEDIGFAWMGAIHYFLIIGLPALLCLLICWSCIKIFFRQELPI